MEYMKEEEKIRMSVNGCGVEMTFTMAPNPKVAEEIKNMLLSSSAQLKRPVKGGIMEKPCTLSIEYP